MSTDAFYHKDSKISCAMRCMLAIMQKHFADGMKADSIACAAHKATDMLNDPGKLGRSHQWRYTKMRGAIEVAISRGFLRFSGKEGELELTGKGRRALEERRHVMHKRRPKKYGRTPQLAS